MIQVRHILVAALALPMGLLACGEDSPAFEKGVPCGKSTCYNADTANDPLYGCFAATTECGATPTCGNNDCVVEAGKPWPDTCSYLVACDGPEDCPAGLCSLVTQTPVGGLTC